MQENKFEEWAVLELFGHQRLAGKVSEAQIGGTSFVRIELNVNVESHTPLMQHYGEKTHQRPAASRETLKRCLFQSVIFAARKANIGAGRGRSNRQQKGR